MSFISEMYPSDPAMTVHHEHIFEVKRELFLGEQYLNLNYSEIM